MTTTKEEIFFVAIPKLIETKHTIETKSKTEENDIKVVNCKEDEMLEI